MMETLVLPCVKHNCILNYFIYFKHNNKPIEFLGGNFTFLDFKGEAGDIKFLKQFVISYELI